MIATPYHPSIHLAASQLVPAAGRCPVCGEPSQRREIAVIQKDPPVTLLKCGHCRACSASHMPSASVLQNYYRDYFHGEGPRVTMPRVDRFVSALLRVISHSDPARRRVRLLDFGGGDGTLGLALADALLKRGAATQIDFTLVDVQEPPRRVRDERVRFRHCARLEDSGGEFNIVLASAVLEHIPELHQVLQGLFAAVAPGGWFYARTPYVAPFKRLLPAFDLTYPGHVHDLGPDFWNRVPGLFEPELVVAASRPSLVETDWWRQPLRTTAAWLLKLPARAELMLHGPRRTPLWPFVGGWEVILRRRIPSTRAENPGAYFCCDRNKSWSWFD